MIAILLAATIALPGSYRATLVRCVDGDTCRFDIHLGMDVTLRNQSVRLCDIDAPEVRGETKHRAELARDALTTYLRRAKVLVLRVPQKKRCEVDCDIRDRWGRLLATIFADGESVNDLMVRVGWAELDALRCEP